MPLSWIFGVADEALPPPDEDALDPELSITRTLTNEDVKAGTFPSINAPPPAPAPSSSSIIAQVAAAGSSQGWRVLSRTDSTEEMTGGIFPSVNDQPSSPTSQEKASGSKPPRPAGLPPTAPRSPPLLAFSRRGGRASKASGSKPADAVLTSSSQQQAPGAAPVAQASPGGVAGRADRPISSSSFVRPNGQPVSRPPVELSFYANQQQDQSSDPAQSEHSSSAPSPVTSTAESPGDTFANKQDSGNLAVSGASDTVSAATMSSAGHQAPSQPTRHTNATTAETQMASPPEYASPPNNSRPLPAIPRPSARPPTAPTAAPPGTGGSPTPLGVPGGVSSTPPVFPYLARDDSASTRGNAALGAVAGVEVEGRAANADEMDGLDDESRRSSKRSSSFSVTGRSIVGESGLLGCFQRRKTAAAARPTHPTFRLLGSRNSTPMSTPGRFRSKRRSSEPPVPPRPQANNMDQAATGASKAAAHTSASPPDPAVLQAARARGLVDGASAGSCPRGDVAMVEGGEARAGEGKNEDRAAPEESKEEEEEEPEAVVAATVSMNGLLECGRAMRMDGKFVGDLVSTGSITVGATGKVTGDLKGLKFLRVEGQVVGDVVCDRVVVLHQGKVYGDITAVSITVGPNATMRGMMNVVDSMASAEAESKTAESKTADVDRLGKAGTESKRADVDQPDQAGEEVASTAPKAADVAELGQEGRSADSKTAEDGQLGQADEEGPSTESKTPEADQLDKAGEEISSSDSDEGLPGLVPMPSFTQESMLSQPAGSDEELQGDAVEEGADEVVESSSLSSEEATALVPVVGKGLTAEEEDTKVTEVVDTDVAAKDTKVADDVAVEVSER